MYLFLFGMIKFSVEVFRSLEKTYLVVSERLQFGS
jgi:hypothetical protein